jgi:8-oxo-dGTP pyrophosphatase MutT (NUDIX family)
MPAAPIVTPPPLLIRPLIGGHALFRNSEGAILMVMRKGSTEWELPGGYAHEHAAATCQRGVREATGLPLGPIWDGRVLAINDRPEGVGVAIALVSFVFDGGVLDGATIELGHEYVDYDWVHPSAMPGRVTSATEWAVNTALNSLHGLAGPGVPYLVGHAPGGPAVAPTA